MLADAPGGPCGDRPIIFHTDRNHTGRFDISKATDHIQDAILDTNLSWFVMQQGANGSKKGWYTKVAFSDLCWDDRQDGQHCDEYPPFATIQVGEFQKPLPSLRAIPASQNERSGGSFGVFYNQCAKGERFGVIPVHHESRLQLPPLADIVISEVPTFWTGCG